MTLTYFYNTYLCTMFSYLARINCLCELYCAPKQKKTIRFEYSFFVLLSLQIKYLPFSEVKCVVCHNISSFNARLEDGLDLKW